MGLFSKPKVPKPVDIWKENRRTGLNIPAQQATGLIDYYGQYVPEFIGLEKELGPQFIGQHFGKAGQYFGGFANLAGRAIGTTSDLISDARAAELGSMTGQASLTRGLMESLSPEQASAVRMASDYATRAQGLESQFGGTAANMMQRYGSQVGQYDPTLGGISGYAGTTISDEQAQGLLAGTLSGVDPNVAETISGANADARMATQMAEEAFARRGTLSPEEQRAAQQQAREAASASGRLGGNAAIAAEVLNREAALAGRRAEASQLTQQAYGQQMGAAQQRTAAEQALYGQRAANIERDIALRQGAFGQGLSALQQRLATQQSLYSQRSAEQERELARRQNLFSQGLAGGSQRTAERQLGFGQLLDIEAQQARLRGEASGAGQNLYELAQQFYTAPGLAALSSAPLSYQAGMNLASASTAGGEAASGEFDYNMPISMAMQRAGALDQYNMAKYQADAQRYGSVMGAVGSLAGAALIPFTGGLSAGLGLTGMAGGAAGATGFGGMGLSAGMGLSSLFGGIPRATPV